jgi:ABC-type transport system involved in multi-copper enzyme maturation permease subunit
MSALHGFGWLAREALADALRRRIALAVGFAALVSIAMLQSCTSCTSSMTVNGEARDVSEVVKGVAGVGTFVMIGLWMIALSGLLAADHLRSTLEDGSALLSLARPISRDAFALARLGGVLFLTYGAALLVLGVAAWLLAARSALPLSPALLAGAACALGCVCVGALAMAASLALPRAATLLLVLVGVFLIAIANSVGIFSESSGGWLGVLDRIGPPLGSTMALALGPWVQEGALKGDLLPLFLRLGAWAVIGLVALVLSFRRIELRG